MESVNHWPSFVLGPGRPTMLLGDDDEEQLFKVEQTITCYVGSSIAKIMHDNPSINSTSFADMMQIHKHQVQSSLKWLIHSIRDAPYHLITLLWPGVDISELDKIVATLHNESSQLAIRLSKSAADRCKLLSALRSALRSFAEDEIVRARGLIHDVTCLTNSQGSRVESVYYSHSLYLHYGVWDVREVRHLNPFMMMNNHLAQVWISMEWLIGSITRADNHTRNKLWPEADTSELQDIAECLRAQLVDFKTIAQKVGGNQASLLLRSDNQLSPSDPPISAAYTDGRLVWERMRDEDRPLQLPWQNEEPDNEEVRYSGRKAQG